VGRELVGEEDLRALGTLEGVVLGHAVELVVGLVLELLLWTKAADKLVLVLLEMRLEFVLGTQEAPASQTTQPVLGRHVRRQPSGIHHCPAERTLFTLVLVVVLRLFLQTQQLFSFCCANKRCPKQFYRSILFVISSSIL